MLLPKIFIIAAQAQVVFSSATALAAKPDKPSKPTVFFIRHGEKPDIGDGLSTDGLRRAECLRNVFAKNSSFSIGHIIAQQPQADGRQQRPYNTVLPLSRDLGLDIDTHCERDDVHCVSKTVKHYSGPGNILICWEHRTMTNITEILGDKNPPQYPTSDFHHIWVDPWPYAHVNDTPINQNCPGLDISEPLSRGLILFLAGLGALVLIGVAAAIFAIVRLTREDDDGYEPIE